jgi:hypothetical protein
MKSFQVTRTIEASPDAVWAILADATRYPEWDPGMDRIEGRIAPGEKITVHSKVNPGRTFPVTVSTFEPGRRMVWTGGMPLGLFKGERTFSLTPAGDGQTEFTMREEFGGPLLPLIGRSIPDLSPSFEAFADGPKQRAEAAND